MTKLKVRDLMTEDVISVRPHDSLTKVYDLMDLKHFRHMPVVDEEGALVGIITQRDLVRGALGDTASLPVTLQRELLDRVRVQEIMNQEPESIDPDRDVREAGELMMEYKLGCLPVVDGDRLVGILTESDFVRYVVDNQ